MCLAKNGMQWFYEKLSTLTQSVELVKLWCMFVVDEATLDMHNCAVMSHSGPGYICELTLKPISNKWKHLH